MSALRIIAPLMAGAIGATGLVATASAAPAATASAAAANQCQLRIQKVRVLDLQHDQVGQDQVFANIGNSRTTTRSYSIPQTRNTLGDGTERFSGTARVALRVKVLGGNLSVRIGSAVVPCRNTTRDYVFDNGDARYKVRALVQILP